jgi:hypothetical protein
MYTHSETLQISWEAYKLGNPKLAMVIEPSAYFKDWFKKKEPKTEFVKVPVYKNISLEEKLLIGDRILQTLLESWATVTKDEGEKVYFKWDNGDENFVNRKNIEKATRKGFVLVQKSDIEFPSEAAAEF